MLKKFLLFLLILALPVVPAFATVSSTTSRMNYTGNGNVDTYSYTFKIFTDSALRVTVRDTDDVETTLALGTDYTVTGVGNSGGGTVVLVDDNQDWIDADGDLVSGYALTIRRVLSLTQETDIRNQGAFYPEVHEDTFDILTMMEQQQQDELNRSIKLPETINPSTFDTDFPASLVGNPGASIIVNDTGDGFTDGPTADAIEDAQANATSAAASAVSAAASAASAASANFPAIAGNQLKVLQVRTDLTGYQFLDLRAPNLGIGTTTPAAGKFTTLEATTTLKLGTTHQGDVLYDNGTSLVRLTPGTSGQFLKTQGSSANPVWADSVPQGVIVMWSGTIATIPSGWELSDGSCLITCPDLRDKFIVGATSDDSGAAKTNYTGSLTQSGGSVHHTHDYSGTTSSGGSQVNVDGSNTPVTSYPHTHTYSGTTTNENAVPVAYYALAFIIKD